MEQLQNLELYNDNCFNIFPKIKEKSVNLFLLDLPYNQTACSWDKDIINLEEMWKHIKRIMKQNGIIIFFCTAKFGYRIIHSNPKWFRYDLIWKKSRKVGFLSANKMPLRQHENIYLFSNDVNEDYNDLNMSRNKDLRQYAQKVKDYIGKSLKQINKDIGNQGLYHFYRNTSSQFGIPTETTYNKLIELYKLDEMPEFIPYEILKGMLEKPPPKIETTYNPQKTEGKPYKTIGKGEVGVYKTKRINVENKGERHPTSLIEYDGDSILIYNNPHKTIHKTQKPVELCEWLIKTYSNEGDTIMDFTMGSGTVAIACLNTKRKFIGIEKDEEIFKIAQNRIIEHLEI